MQVLQNFHQQTFYEEMKFHISIASQPGNGLVAREELHTVNIDAADYVERESDDDYDDDHDNDDDDLSSLLTAEDIHIKIGNRLFAMRFKDRGVERKIKEIIKKD